MKQNCTQLYEIIDQPHFNCNSRANEKTELREGYLNIFLFSDHAENVVDRLTFTTVRRRSYFLPQNTILASVSTTPFLTSLLFTMISKDDERSERELQRKSGTQVRWPMWTA